MAVYGSYDTNCIADPRLRVLIELIMDVTSGHNHDGSNSKSVSAGTPGAGSLSADASGRAIIASDFFDAATVLAKFATDSIDNAQLLKVIKNGSFLADAATRALFADGIFTLAKLADTAKTRILMYQIENLSAGADISARTIFAAPTGLDVTLTSVDIIPQDSSAGIDDSNTCVIDIADGAGNSIVSKTYNTSTPLPGAGIVGNLGALNATYKVLSAGEKLTFAVTNGSTANPPAMMLQVTYTITEAA